ncbi:MAG TPA: hypothetical protein PKD83_08825 [Ignavibacteria bacterium]|nr:hypothetical protein [Ignavibacteria bacterium]
MKNFTKNFGFLFALIISFALLVSCGGKKEGTGEKEDTKKEETKKEEVKKETTTTTSGGNQLYFVEEYTKDGQEVGKSDKFFISPKGGYITAMLKTAQPIGVGSVDVRLERESLDGSEIIDTQPYDVSPDKNYFFFDKVTFYKSGDYKVMVFKKDGTVLATGNVRIEFK